MVLKTLAAMGPMHGYGLARRIEQLSDDAMQVSQGTIFDTLLHDLRFALRLLIKDRWFTAAVVVALALGAGVNTTVFTVVNGWNLRDLPVDEPGRLMHLGTRDAHGRPRGVSYLDFPDWRDGLRAFTGLAAYADTSMILRVEGRPADHLAGCFVSANAFSALRERPIVGRDFRPEDA